MKRWYWLFGGMLFLALLVVLIRSNRPSSSSAIQIVDAWARSVAIIPQDSGHNPGGISMGSTPSTYTSLTSAVYMIIRNRGGAPDRLIGVQTDIATQAEIHQTVMNGDVMQMQPLNGLDIPAQSEVQLKPGGYHIMLIGLKHDLKAGDTITLILKFAQSGDLEIKATVRQP